MIIALVNHKGSVGKTSTAFNVAAALYKRGFDAICVDLDREQSDLSEQCEAFGFPYVSVSVLDLPRVLASYGEKGCKAGAIRLVECPPRNDPDNPKAYKLTLEALRHAHLALVLTQCEYLPIKGIFSVYELIQEARQDNPRLQTRVLATMYSPPFKDERDQLRAMPDIKMCKTVIPRASIVAKAAAQHKPVLDIAPESQAARAFKSLASEILEWREGKWDK